MHRPSNWWLEEPLRSFIRHVTLTFDLLTLELVYNVTDARTTFLPILVLLQLSLSSYGRTRVELTTWRHSYNLDVWGLTFEVSAHVGDTDRRTPSCTKFEIRRPSSSEDMAHFPSQEIGQQTFWPLTLWPLNGVRGDPVMGFSPVNFRLAKTFRSLLMDSRKSSKSRGDFSTPRTPLRFTDKAFAVSAPSAWNLLPIDIRDCSSEATFKKHLKTFLFHVDFN